MPAKPKRRSVTSRAIAQPDENTLVSFSAQDTHDHWQLNRSHAERQRYMLENHLHADVTFRVGNDREPIQANRAMLSIHSPYFDRMLNGLFKEASEDPVIKDVDPDTFRAVLRYCYYDCTYVDSENAFSTMCAANMFILPQLEAAARQAISENLDSSNIVSLYKFATSTDDAELKASCYSYFQEKMCASSVLEIYKHALAISDHRTIDLCFMFFTQKMSACVVWDVYVHAFRVRDALNISACRRYFRDTRVAVVREALSHKSFLNIPQGVLVDFLKINNVCDETENFADEIEEKDQYENHYGICIAEIELFKACDSWAEGECRRKGLESDGANKRHALGECLRLIRFPSMLRDDLVDFVYPTGILTEDELSSINKRKTSDPDHPVTFPCTQRYVLQTLIPTADKKTILIAVEERILLTRIWFLRDGVYRVIIKDNQTGTGDFVERNSTRHPTLVYQCDDDSGPYSFHYINTKPVVLEPRTSYTISIQNLTQTWRVLADKPGLSIAWMTPFKEVKITSAIKGWMYVVTLSYV